MSWVGKILEGIENRLLVLREISRLQYDHISIVKRMVDLNFWFCMVLLILFEFHLIFMH